MPQTRRLRALTSAAIRARVGLRSRSSGKPDTGDHRYGGNSIYRITPAGVYKNLYTMAGGNSLPSPLAFGSDGNLYGTVADAAGFGNVGGIFKITLGGAFTIIHGFSGTDCCPSSGLILGSDGKPYGMTDAGGAHNQGVLYRVTTAGVLTDLFSNVKNATDGYFSYNSLLQATNGNLYGAAQGGGLGNQGGVYELTSAGAFSSFLFDLGTKPNLGDYPSAPLMQRTNGTVFGTTSQGGPSGSEGTFFSLNIGASPFIKLVSPVPAGKEGSQIGILGQGFNSSSVVKFAGVTATTKVLTGTTFILATVPAGALTGKVTVTTGSTTLSTTGNYRVLATLTSFTPMSGPVGTVVTISGAGLKQTTKVTFNKVSATFTVKSDSQITATVPAGATTGTIVVFTTGGSVARAKTFTVN